MKKLLLIAAMVAVALGAIADGYKIEKVWEINNPQQLLGLDRNEIRQGFGMNGKFYVNSKLNKVDTIDDVIIPTVPVVYEIDENGLTGVTFPGTTNTAITRDEAGNIILSVAQFPNNWVNASIRVINPTTGESVDYPIPEEIAVLGRCDFLGFAKGNLMEDGDLYITGATQGTGFSHLAIAGGDVDYDNCFYMVGEGVTPTSSTVINYYTDINGDEALLYVTRNDHPRKLAYVDDQYTSTLITLPPGKSNTNGMFPLVWDGKEFFIYSILNDANQHYMDGFAIAESGAEAPIVSVPCATSTVNGFQGNWLNAEVDANGVTIYQYFPGNEAGHFTVWRLTKDEPSVPNVYMLGGDDQLWDPSSGTMLDYDAENGVYTATINFPAELNYFGFTTELAENNDDGGWNYIEPFRFGAIADEGTDYWYTGEEDFISLTWDEYHAIRIPSGEYKLTVDLNEMKLYVEPKGIRGDVNKDGFVKIDDVTALIDYLLSGNEEGIDINAADCNKSGDVKIDDVTTLIDFLLGGNWPE